MESPASVNFYDNNDIEKQFTVIKQEPFIDADETHGGLGLGDFLNSEESVDIWAYLEKYDHGSNNAQLSTRDTAEQLLQRLNTLPPAPRAQQSDSDHPMNQMHYQNLAQSNQTVDTMPLSLNTPHNQPQNTGDQADFTQFIDSVHHHQQTGGPGMEGEVNSTNSSTCSSVASSPGRLMCDLQASATSSPGESTGKKKRNNPSPGTEEYKQKRARNNDAVRKCREKTKQKNKELQDKVGELQTENASLKKRVEMLTKELTVLKSLFTNVNKPPPPRLERAPVNSVNL